MARERAAVLKHGVVVLDEVLGCKTALTSAVLRVWDGERRLEVLHGALQPGLGKQATWFVAHLLGMALSPSLSILASNSSQEAAAEGGSRGKRSSGTAGELARPTTTGSARASAASRLSSPILRSTQTAATPQRVLAVDLRTPNTSLHRLEISPDIAATIDADSRGGSPVFEFDSPNAGVDAGASGLRPQAMAQKLPASLSLVGSTISSRLRTPKLVDRHGDGSKTAGRPTTRRNDWAPSARECAFGPVASRTSLPLS